jgi:hypothetical protein
MRTEVLATNRADQQINCLTRRHAKTFDDALAYRLTGETPLDHICVRHLRGLLREVVAFETASRAWILLVGPHDDHDPILNVYAELYRLLDVEPEPGSGRTKPPGCDETEGEPPLLGAALTAILDRAASLRKTRQR